MNRHQILTSWFPTSGTNDCMYELTKKPRLLKLLLMILWQIPGKNLFGRVRLILAHSFWENWSIMRGGKMKVKAVKKHMAPHIIENQKADYMKARTRSNYKFQWHSLRDLFLPARVHILNAPQPPKQNHHLGSRCSYKWASRNSSRSNWKDHN